ncbi:unnamed protein product [Schistosoma curassoni]|uniref:Uncharacterized protein n=1 Tax=Schistosoma curassoni TaxID=6186 RepID=A0A183K5E9_9TREM|nr:unnamed protein product [Schistosoma curassoni]
MYILARQKFMRQNTNTQTFFVFEFTMVDDLRLCEFDLSFTINDLLRNS